MSQDLGLELKAMIDYKTEECASWSALADGSMGY